MPGDELKIQIGESIRHHTDNIAALAERATQLPCDPTVHALMEQITISAIAIRQEFTGISGYPLPLIGR